VYVHSVPFTPCSEMYLIVNVDRKKLPHRRPNITGVMQWAGRHITVTIGYDPVSGNAREVFASGARFGSDVQAVIDDACVVISLALQFGVEPVGLSRSLGTMPNPYDPEREERSSVIGVIVDYLIAESRQNPMPEVVI